MHVSVSKLGSASDDAGGAARAIVEYLTGGGAGPGGQRSAPAMLGKASSMGTYFADSAVRAGRWHGAGAESLILASERDGVDPEMLKRILVGQHPTSGEQLVGAAGSAARADHASHDDVELPKSGPLDELLGAAEAAKLIGVERQYITDLAKRTATQRRQIETPPSPPRAPHSRRGLRCLTSSMTN